MPRDEIFDAEFRDLDDRPKKEWPRVEVGEDEPAIIKLEPDSELHEKVLEYLLTRLEYAERAMSVFYPRWYINEMKLQGYVSLPQWEKDLKAINDTGAPPKVTSIVIPYTMAISSTIVTYLLHTFTGRKPIMQVGTNKSENVVAARALETILQYNADHTKLPAHMFHFFQDGQLYGLGIFRSLFVKTTGLRTRRTKQKQYSTFGLEMGEKSVRRRETVITYEGNETFSQDPFMFFPDPSVPMTEVNRRGEYVWWRSFEGRHTLLKMQAAGDYKWVDKATKQIPVQRFLPAGTGGNDSGRSLVSGGEPHPGARTWMRSPKSGAEWMQVDQGTCTIIPKSLGLGSSEVPQMWIFTILNKSQIVQAEPLDADHEMHPVCVAEPYSLGYGFGNPGIVDYLAPIQDVISWLVNSHIDNVRKVINDVLVYDPSAIEQQDLKQSGSGKLVRLKRAAIGKDVRTVVQQLQVQDVTQNHIKDAELFIRIGQLLSAVSDNVLGIQDQGGRKTATEVRTSSEAAASRLAAQARIQSSQAIVDLTKIWSLNLQQYLSDEFALQVIGQEAIESQLLTADSIQGDFNFPIHDGTLPLDRVALLDVWKELYDVILKDQELRARYDVPKLFEYIAELGGAKNIEAMRVDVVPDEMADSAVQAGNVIPIAQALGKPGPSGLINALGGSSPGGRLAGGMTQ